MHFPQIIFFHLLAKLITLIPSYFWDNVAPLQLLTHHHVHSTHSERLYSTLQLPTVSVDIIDNDSRPDQRSQTHYLLSAFMVASSILNVYWRDPCLLLFFHSPAQICSNFCFQVAAHVLPMWGALGQWRKQHAGGGRGQDSGDESSRSNTDF